MWLHLTFLLIIGAVLADHRHAWETGNEYHFLMGSRTLTVLDKLAQQFSGISMKGDVTIQVKSPDMLLAKVSKTQYAPVHKALPKGWESEIAGLKYHELSLSEKPFEIKLKQGVIREMLVDQDVPTWEVNLLKSIVSQLQIDTQGENAIASRGTQVPNQPFGAFKVMEDSVGGKCEVLYDINPLPEDVLLKKAKLVPLPNLQRDGHFFNITKTKNYTRCEQQMAYHFGITGKTNWKPRTNDGLLSRSSTSRILISGNLKHFTIQSSETKNKIFIRSKIHDTYSGAVFNKMNLTLERMSKISNPMSASNNLVSTGNLVYIYNNSFSSQRTPKMDEAPESPLLPYFMGYKGKSIQKSEENYALVAVRLISQITGEIEYFPVDIPQEPFTETLERFIILIRLIRTMNVKQIAEVENRLPELFRQDNRNKFSNKEDQKFYDQTAWDVFCHAVAQAGTGPAFITIKNWIKNKKLEGIQAAQIISKIPKAVRTPTAEYVKAFFELITDEQVTKQRFLNATAPLSFAELVRYTQSNKSSVYYPVGRMASKNDNALLQTYISYMATQLREAIKESDSPRIQTYIMALGNFGHAKILSVFEPYLEGTLPVSKFQRLMMVISLSRLSESFPRVARSVAYKIYMNVMEAYEIRCAAVYIVMKTNPPLGMLQRMANFTNQDEDKHVNSAVTSTIDALANLKQPELQDLANKARIAKKLLSSQYYDEKYSRSIIKDMIITAHNTAHTFIIQTIGSDDTDILKGAQLGIHQLSYGGFNLPSSRIIYAISSIKQLLDTMNRCEWRENKSEKKLTIEEIIEKLGIKPEDPEQLEGNIFVDTIFTSEFYPFDNHTVEEVGYMINTYATSMKIPGAFESRNLNYLYHYDMTLAFPTESGLPFIYTLTIPQLMRINSGGSHKVLNESSVEFTVAGHIILREKIQSRTGFVTPFEHRHYIAGIDINTQIFVPAGLNFYSQSDEKRSGYKRMKLKMKREYHRYGTGHLAIHHSVVPYIARNDILNLQPIILSNDTRLVHTKPPHGVEFSMGNATITARSDHIDSKASKKTGMEALVEIFKVFCNASGAHYRRFDAIIYPMETQVNLTFNSFDLLNPNNSKVTIPAIIDKRPDSETRRQQFLKEINKDINSAIGYINDIGISTENYNYVFTYALANSCIDKKLQILYYWNIQSPKNGEVFEEFCTVGHWQSSSLVYQDIEKAIKKEITKDVINADMRFGSCTNGETIRLNGNWTRTDDFKEMIMKSEKLEECRQDMKQGNKGLLTCQEASGIIKQKYHLMMSIDTDSDRFYMLANKIILLINKLFFKKDVEMPSLGHANKNTVNIEIKLPLNNSDAKISLITSNMDVTFSLADFFEDYPGISLKEYLIEKEEEGFSCTLDKTQAVTFDNKVYPLKLGKCWHVMVTTYPKRNPNNPEKTLTIPEDLRVMVMVREMDDGSKQIRMILGDQEIHLQKSGNRLEATINEQVVNFSRHESYRENKFFEIYERSDGSITVFSSPYEIFAVYDGERIRFEMSFNYLNAVRGLCGNYDLRSDNDFVIPKNCILTKPEEFAATYALTQENCQGTALQNKRKAEKAQCKAWHHYSSNVISDREAGRMLAENRN